jgi:hypothetical protein
MSLCIAVVIPEGIVVAGDSRQVGVVGGINRIGSDSAVKVFALTDTVIAATAGWAVLQPQSATPPRNIASFMEDFKATIPADSSVASISALLWTYFNTLYQQHITQVAGSAVQAGQVVLNFIVAGYDPGSRVGSLFGLDVPAPAAPTAPGRTSQNPGCWWIGQADVAARIVNGYDPQLLTLPPLQAPQQGGTAQAQLQGLSYIILWGMMTVQDAIDFAVSMIQVTSTIQKFTAGTVLHPGGLAGVGGQLMSQWYSPERPLNLFARRNFTLRSVVRYSIGIRYPT